MSDGMLKRLTRGSAATLMRQMINLVGQILLVPVYLKYWGPQLYGEWQILSASVAYLTLLDLGVQTFAANRMNQCAAICASLRESFTPPCFCR
jgi:O-antigen/teichoic acid export membrane protein